MLILAAFISGGAVALSGIVYGLYKAYRYFKECKKPDVYVDIGAQHEEVASPSTVFVKKALKSEQPKIVKVVKTKDFTLFGRVIFSRTTSRDMLITSPVDGRPQSVERPKYTPSPPRVGIGEDFGPRLT